MKLEQFLTKLRTTPSEVTFNETMATINHNFSFQPTGFTNGNVRSEAGQNEGSCKIFALAQHLELTADACLACFGDYYRKDVLEHPDAQDHCNIRQFLMTGLKAVSFDRFPLAPKANT